ncbi:MAG TPA: hypothetical protein VNY73_10900, partial [Bacteroidia bacterium]|nr:hypothetical protein [Bacteroidia bacterium]
MQTTKIIHSAVILSSLLCAGFFLVLFHSIRFEPDDMITSGQLNNNSLIDLLINKYYSTSFRPLFIVTSFFTIGYKTIDVTYYFTTVFVYFVAVYLLFVFSMYKLLKEIFSLAVSGVKEKLLLLGFANLLFTCLYFLATEKIEIFGWYCCSTIYLWPVSITCFSAWILVKRSQRKTDFILLFTCALLIAGGAEHVPASVIAGITVIITLLFFEKGKDKSFFVENKGFIRKTIFFTSVLT